MHGAGGAEAVVTDAQLATVALYRFIAAWVLIMAYVVIANVIYFGKVLPTLHRAGLDSVAKFLPSDQAKQGRAALEVVRRQGQHGFAVWWLTVCPIISTVLVLTVVAVLVIPTIWAML
jgi:hypothetical protein